MSRPRLIPLVAESRNVGVRLLEYTVGLIVFVDAVLMLPYADLFYGAARLFPREQFFAQRGVLTPLLWAVDGVFTGSWGPTLFLVALAAGAAYHLLGQRRLLANLLLAGLLFCLYTRNSHHMDGSDAVIAVLLPFLVLYYLRRLRPGWGSLTTVSRFAALGILVQVALIYASTGLYKIDDEAWSDGSALYYVMRLREFSATPLNEWLTDWPLFVIGATYFTLAWELLFPLLVWWRPCRTAVLLLGVSFHLGIYLLLRIEDFSWIMIGSYAVFYTDREWVRARRGLRNFTGWLGGRVVRLRPEAALALLLLPLAAALGGCQQSADIAGVVQLESVVRTGDRNTVSDRTAYAVGPALRRGYRGVRAQLRLVPIDTAVIIRAADGRTVTLNGTYFADTNVVRFLELPLLAPAENPADGVLLDEATARRLGLRPGQELWVDGEPARLSAIYRSWPLAGPAPAALLPMAWFAPAAEDKLAAGWYQLGALTFLELELQYRSDFDAMLRQCYANPPAEVVAARVTIELKAKKI